MDAMMFYLVPEDHEEAIERNISPANIVRYESTDEFIFSPNHEMLYGLTLATTIEFNKVTEDTPDYYNAEDIFEDYKEQVIQYPCDEVLLQGKVTTYAYEKLSHILRMDVHSILGNQGPITVKNIKLILQYLEFLPDRIDVYQEMIKHALNTVTIEGATIPDIRDMIMVDTTGFTDEIKDLIEKSKTDPKYIVKVDEKYKELVQFQLKQIDPELKQRIESSNRIKMAAITSVFTPQLALDEKGYRLADTSQIHGLNEKDLRMQASTNRALLSMKQELVPKGGWLDRQIEFAGQGDKFRSNKTDDENIGIYIPRNRAEGRTTLSGEVLRASSDKGKVRVRSMAVSKLPYITPDMVSQIHNKFVEGSNIGLKFASASAGNITQGGLSLKHDARLRQLDDTTKLYAPYNCTVIRDNDEYISIFKDGKDTNFMKHYVPISFILMKNEFEKGELIGFLPELVTPEHLADYLIDFLGGRSTTDIDNPGRVKVLSYNISPYEGKIKYEKNYIHIGSHRLPRSSDRLYIKFEGAEVSEGDILCNGVLDCSGMLSNTDSIQDYYTAFRAQLHFLMPQFNENTLEMLFRMTHSWRGDKLENVGIVGKVKEDKSWLTNISYEGAKNIVLSTLSATDSIASNPDDLFNEFFLNLITNEK